MTVQIDHLLISTRGIFVIETKNLSGTIYGSDKRREWIQTFGYGNSTYTFYSPVKQNYTHICTLKDLFHPAVRVNNVVIFAQNNTARIKSESVYSLSAFKKFLTEQPQTLLTERARDELYTEILRYRNGCKISVRKHVKNIRAMQKDMKKNICPRCKGRLVLRNGPYGEFYGCERFPKCNFTKELDE